MDKKTWLAEAILAGGVAKDMCAACTLKILNSEFICSDCPQGYRTFPDNASEYFNKNYQHGRGQREVTTYSL